MPPSVPSVTPAVHPLWDLATKGGKKDGVELHGETVTRGVSEVIYTAKQPLPPDRLDLVTMSVKLPVGEEGESVYFPTVQSCEKGQNRWIQIPAEGESADDLEEPAPAVVLTPRRAATALLLLTRTPPGRAPRSPRRVSRPRPSAVTTMGPRCGWRSPRPPWVRWGCWRGSAG